MNGRDVVERPAIAWSALVDAALVAGADLSTLPDSEFLERVLNDAILGLVPGSGWPRMSYCSHTALATELGDFDGTVIFTAQMLAACASCARDIRDEIETGRKRTCQRCDDARATALHRAELSVPGVLLAVPLCDACAAAERLCDSDPNVARAVERTR